MPDEIDESEDNVEPDEEAQPLRWCAVKTRIIDGIEYEDQGNGTLVAIGELSSNRPVRPTMSLAKLHRAVRAAPLPARPRWR